MHLVILNGSFHMGGVIGLAGVELHKRVLAHATTTMLQ